MWGRKQFLDWRQIINYPNVYYSYKNHEHFPAVALDKNVQNRPTLIHINGNFVDRYTYILYVMTKMIIYKVKLGVSS